jgi:hypothetical protein
MPCIDDHKRIGETLPPCRQDRTVATKHNGKIRVVNKIVRKRGHARNSARECQE